MRVLALSNLYPSAAKPTFGTFNRDTFLALSRYCDVRVVAPTPAWQLWSRPRALLGTVHETATGLEASFPPYLSIPGARCLDAGGLVASLLPSLAELRERFPWDVVLAAWVYPDATAATVLSSLWGTPIVTVALGTDLNVVPTRPGVGCQVRWALSRAARVVTVSRALADRAIACGARRDRVVVQHNAVDGDAFALRDRREARLRLGLGPDRPTIGYVGHHRHIKGTDVLVAAMDRLVHRLGRKDVQLVLVGQGDLTERVRAEVARLGLSGHVRFCGSRPHDEIPAWMAALDVLALPSRHEGCPNVVLEALASGRPVVASRVGGVPEIVGQRCGLLVPPADPAALADALRDALGRSWDPEALRASVPLRSWDAVGRRYADLLTAVVAEEAEVRRPAVARASLAGAVGLRPSWRDPRG